MTDHPYEHAGWPMIGPWTRYSGGRGKVWLNPANVAAVEQGDTCCIVWLSGYPDAAVYLDTEAEKVVRACWVKLGGQP